MEVGKIDVYDLQKGSQLSATRCADFSEAAAICLDVHGHRSGETHLEVVGDLKGQFELTWSQVTQQMRDSRADMVSTVESGAYCIAMLVLKKMENLQVVKQSVRQTGFDYWMGQEGQIGFQGYFRLEVSGILKGSQAMIKQRLREKVTQTRKSDNLRIPAFVAVVEFSQPSVQIKKR